MGTGSSRFAVSPQGDTRLTPAGHHVCSAGTGEGVQSHFALRIHGSSKIRLRHRLATCFQKLQRYRHVSGDEAARHSSAAFVNRCSGARANRVNIRTSVFTRLRAPLFHLPHHRSLGRTTYRCMYSTQAKKDVERSEERPGGLSRVPKNGAVTGTTHHTSRYKLAALKGCETKSVFTGFGQGDMDSRP